MGPEERSDSLKGRPPIVSLEKIFNSTKTFFAALHLNMLFILFSHLSHGTYSMFNHCA